MDLPPAPPAEPQRNAQAICAPMEEHLRGLSTEACPNVSDSAELEGSQAASGGSGQHSQAGLLPAVLKPRVAPHSDICSAAAGPAGERE